VTPTALLASIPSPSQGVWNIGPLPVRAYALCILAGIVVAIIVGNRRWIARGGRAGTVADVAVWAVPFGVVGGRLYHVITDWQLYFGPTGSGWVNALKIWDGGLGIWGAVALGGVGAWIGCHRRGIPLPPFADAIAPGVALAQAMGRFGNWFNQELFGAPTTLPWGLQISPEHRPAGYEQFETFHPTFLYESLWCVTVACLVIWADRRWRMGHGRAFALYIGLYSAGRGVIESLRIDDAHHFFGIRLNVFTSIVVVIGAVAYIVISARLRPGREDVVEPGHEQESSPEGAHDIDLVEAADAGAHDPGTVASPDADPGGGSTVDP
jgi:prolipoprotein diacylglyceryl transferase